MFRLSHSDLRTTTARARTARRGRTPAREPRWTRPPWQVFHAGFERLEDRTMLSGITSGQVTAINQGLGALSGLGTHLNSFNQLDQNLRVVNTTLSQVLDIGQTLTTDLSSAASSYLAAQANAAADLATALSSSTPGNVVTVTGSADASGNLTFHVSLDVTRSANGPNLNLGPQAAALGVNTAATVNLSVELIANFSFAVSADPSDTFQLTFDSTNPLKVIGTASTTNLSAGLNVGFLGAQINGGSVTLNAELDAAFTKNPLQVSDLQTSDPSTILTLTPTSSLTATLPVTATLGTFTPSGTLTVTSNDLFGSTPPSVSFDNNFSNDFANFGNLSADQVLGNLNNLASFLSQFSNSSVLSTPIPFAKSQTLGTVLNLGTALTTELGLGTDPAKVSGTSPLEKVVTGQNNTSAVTPNFATVQDLVADLAQALNVSQNAINAQYDSTSQNLTFAVDFKFNAPELKVPLAFSLNLAPLGNVSSSDQLTLDANGEVKFTFGFNLAAAKPPELLTPINANVPSNLSGDAHFQLSIDGGALTQTITVSNSGISSPADIVANINTGLTNAGITNVTAVGMNPATLNGTDWRQIALVGGNHSIELFAAPNDPIITDLKFDNGVASHAHAGQIFVRDASFNGTATLADTNFSAVANLGPISIHASGGLISGTAGFTVGPLTDPNTNSTTIPLDDLLAAITGTISSTFASPTITGSANLTMPNISVDAGLLSLSGNPTLTVSVTNLGNPSPTVMVTQNTDLTNSSLFNFESLSFDTIFHDVIAALVQIKNLLGNYSQFGFLNTPLPIINTSVASLIDYAGKLGTDIAKAQEDPNGTLQELTSELSAALGLNAGGPVSLSFDPAADALRLDLSFHTGSSANLPLNLSLGALAQHASGSPPVGSVGQLLSASSSGNLTVKADASAHLSLGFDLGQNFKPFLDSSPGHTTAITVGANISTPGGVNLSLNVGPVGLGVTNGNITLNDGSTDPTTEATFSFGLAPGRQDLTSLTTSSFQATLKGGASLSLPLYLEPVDMPLGGTSNVLAITIPDLNALLAGNANSVQITTPDLTNLFGSLSVLGLLQNPSLFVNGIEGVLSGLQTGLNSKVFSVNLPLLGNDLQKAAHFLSDLVSQADTALKTLGNTLKNDTVQNLIADLKQGIVTVFGPSPGLGLLENPDGTPATPATALNDVAIDYYDASGNNLSLNPANPSQEDAIQVNIKLGGDLVDSSFGVSSSLGLPGLGISTSGNIKVDLPWTFNFGFGLSVHDGFYLDTSSTASPAFDVHLNVTAPGLNLTGQLGFLAITAADGTAKGNTSFTGDFNVNLLDPNNDGKNRLPLTYLLSGPDFSNVVSATFTADAGVHLHLTTGFGSADFPSLQADLDITWMFSTADWQSGGDKPDVAFNNVELDLGSFISNFAGPIIQQVKNIIDPVEPVLNVLTARIPVISDLSGQDISLLSLAAIFGNVPQSDVNDFVSVYNALKGIVDAPVPTPGMDVMISLGSFDLNSYDLRSAPTRR